MPLDIMRDDINTRNMTWKLRFCWWPERCSISKRSVWLNFAYYGEKTNYYRPELIYTWHERNNI